MLSKDCIRASWEAQREEIREFLIRERKFNPKHVDRAVDNFIDSVVFAGLPSGTEAGIRAAAQQWAKEKASG